MRKGLLLATLVLLLGFAATAYADAPASETVHNSSDGAALFLFGAFCALWAQNTGRSAWLWFFLGLLFSVITVIFLLYKNSKDRAARAVASA